MINLFYLIVFDMICVLQEKVWFEENLKEFPSILFKITSSIKVKKEIKRFRDIQMICSNYGTFAS